MRVTEGGIELEVPGESTEGVEAPVFYNPRQELNRDLTIAVLRAYREREPRAATYLDAMTASGVRGIRAAADGWTVTCCDRDPEAVALARENRDRNGVEADVVGEDANVLMHERSHGPEPPFDVVDLDPYGTPIPFADAAFATARNLVCVTATDTAPLCGAHLRSGIRSYAAVPRNTDYHAEMGVRILLSALARTAARYDVGVTPLLTHATSHYVRTYLELDHRATAADATLEGLGHLYHCEDCLHREADPGLLADPIDACPNCDGDRLLAAGPIWLDAYRDRAFVASVRGKVVDAGDADEANGPADAREANGPADAGEESDSADASDPADAFGTASEAEALCETLEAELDEPTHYDQHRLCKEWGLPANAMADFLADLRDAGYDASRAHFGGTTFKTDATVGEIREATAERLA